MEEKEEADSNNTTTSNGSYHNAPSEITLFAPFEANRANTKTLALLQGSSGAEDSDQGVSSREIEFQDSATHTTGNAKVLFRKLIAAVSTSGGSTSSYSPVSTPSPAQLSSTRNRVTRPYNLEVSTSVPPPERGHGRRQYHHERFSPNSSISSSNMASSSGGGHGASEEDAQPCIKEERKISLPSYSDTHQRMMGEGPRKGGGEERVTGGGGGGAVNKTEMLKRFGNIADSNVQVRWHDKLPLLLHKANIYMYIYIYIYTYI